VTIWPHAPPATNYVPENYIAYVDANFIAKVYEVVMDWIGVPIINVRIQDLKTGQVISEDYTVCERPLPKPTTIG
jgi:hypothetical protein